MNRKQGLKLLRATPDELICALPFVDHGELVSGASREWFR